MKKTLCALLAAALMLCAFAWAEDVEILEVQGDVVGESVGEPLATPKIELPDLSGTAEPAESEEPDEAEASAEPETTDGAEEAEASPTPSLAPTATPAPNMMHVGFEDGFALRLPEGWLLHPTNREMAEQGVVYCLSDAEGEGWLYVQSWDTGIADMDALQKLVERATDSQISGVYSFNGSDFVVYELNSVDMSCCATLLGDKLLNLVFTPQSDPDFMAVAAQILNTYELL